MDSRQAIDELAKELEEVRKSKVNKVKKKVRKGKYNVSNREVALSLFVSH